MEKKRVTEWISKLTQIIANICLVILIIAQIYISNTNLIVSNRITGLAETTGLFEESQNMRSIFNFIVEYSPSSLIYFNLAMLYGLEIVDITDSITYKLTDIKESSSTYKKYIDKSIYERQSFINDIKNEPIIHNTYQLESSINNLLQLDFKNLKGNERSENIIVVAQREIVDNADKIMYYALLSLIVTTIGINKLFSIIENRILKHIKRNKAI